MADGGGALLAEAIGFHQSGNWDEAERRYRALLASAPDHADANHNLGVLLVQQGDLLAALERFRAAVAVPEGNVAHWFSLVECQVLLGRLADALLSIADAERAGLREPEATRLRRRVAAASLPGPSEGDAERIVTLFATQSYREAETEALRLAAWWPKHGFGWKALGAIRMMERRFTEALGLLQKAAGLMPDDPETQNKLGGVLHAIGRLAEAERHYRRAIELNPRFADAYSNLGLVLRDLGRMEEAEQSYRLALEIRPGLYQARGNLGAFCKDTGRLSEAVGHFQDALALEPTHVEALSNLAGALSELGRYTEAEQTYLRALALRPDWAQVRSNYLFFLAYFGLAGREQYLKEARAWEAGVIAPAGRAAARARRFANPPLAGRKLRVGYVSGDFKTHPVSRFIEPIIENHDRSRIEVHAFATTGWRDAITERIHKKSDRWHLIAGLSDDDTVRLIGELGIDVLVDLSGHTGANRLGVFARRAAPVQCHYLGYFASTGLTEMDYWIGDAVLHPAGHDGQYAERVWRLPRVWVSYEAPTEAPAPHWACADAGPLRLGSFNHLGKITDRTIALWAKVLARLPQARLVLKTRELEDAANRARIEAAFGRLGIGAQRLELRGRTANWAEHMAMYDAIDIALDPVGGIGGGTTTCETLWMGVPVVTLAGGSHADRMTASMLSSLGFGGWAADNEEEYVAKVGDLAAAVNQRKALRRELRGVMRTSPLCDARDLAVTLEDAFESMFDAYGKGQSGYRRGVAEGFNRRGIRLVERNRFSEATVIYRKAIEVDEDSAVAHVKLANALAALGRNAEAKAQFERGLTLAPEWGEGRSNYLVHLCSTGMVSPDAYLAEAANWEAASLTEGDRETARARRFPSADRTNRRLRIGYVSGDFRNHPVSMFAQPLFASHDRRRVEVFAYHAFDGSDEVTERIRDSIEHWHDLNGLSDEAACALVRRHGIDVLVDLSGHTRHNRLGVFARRAAPVQCHYLGYFASTGLTEMDGWITDSLLVPDALAPMYRERIWRLPRVWVSYRIPDNIPEPIATQRSDTAIVLGSFNHIGKLTVRTVELWARIMRRLPGATLMIKSQEFGDPANVDRLCRVFESAGVSAVRLVLRGRTADWSEHMKHYNAIDIALDPVGGVVGGTTTCEALAMGVPVVTLLGRWHGERMSGSVLDALGHGEWATTHEEHYMDAVCGLAADPRLRRQLRRELRPAMLGSKLCDPKDLAVSLESACESMFDLWRKRSS